MNARDRVRCLDELTAAGAQLAVDDHGYPVGFVGNWRLAIGGRGYWEAKPVLGWGMPLAHAIHLHTMPLPCAAFVDFPTIVGQVVRVDGYAGGHWPTRTVRRYHIDTVGGLRIFADYVSRPGLTEAVINAPCPYPEDDDDDRG